MCGRFTITIDEEMLLNTFELMNIPFAYERSYNVAPSHMIPAIIADRGTNRIGQLKWGLVPSWAKDPAIGNKLINARAETLLDKPSFKQLVHRKRCIIPADGFYEWKTGADSRKVPMRIRVNDQPLFAMAGLYDTWTAPDGSKLHTCTIITTEANEFVQPIHHRMPVILPQEHLALWLDRSVNDWDQLRLLLKPYPAVKMNAYEVSSQVGNVKNNHPDCIKPILT